MKTAFTASVPSWPNTRFGGKQSLVLVLGNSASVRANSASRERKLPEKKSKQAPVLRLLRELTLAARRICEQALILATGEPPTRRGLASWVLCLEQELPLRAGIDLRLALCALRGASAPMREQAPILENGEPPALAGGGRHGRRRLGASASEGRGGVEAWRDGECFRSGQESACGLRCVACAVLPHQCENKR